MFIVHIVYQFFEKVLLPFLSEICSNFNQY